MSYAPSKTTQRLEKLKVEGEVGTLLIVLGDQLDCDSEVVAQLDTSRDAILMMELVEEATHVATHKQRIAVFLAAMRHAALEFARRGYRVQYMRLEEDENTQSLGGEIERACDLITPERLVVVRPGEWRVLRAIEGVAEAAGIELDMQEDPHFLDTPGEFAEWADGRKALVLETYYRMMRKRYDVLMDDGEPEGGAWNFDKENRAAYKRSSPPPRPAQPRADVVTRDVLDLVRERFGESPGRLDAFPWPVTRSAALEALEDFLEHRLPDFGTYQDALVAGEPWMFHSLLSVPLNLKLLNPREVIEAAIERYAGGAAPLNSVEGFVRQLLGWREFIRGVYWYEGAAYAERNALEQQGALPAMYWTGETDMRCMEQALGQVLEFGYGHHIQRLMITGNFALTSGVHPRAISDWYLGMYVDAVDWVTLPNTLGMAMHADGGVVGTKPYAASGRYVERMGDYCGECRYKPGKRAGDDACPLTTFYWDFLLRNEARFRDNNRMKMMLKHVERMSAEEQHEIRAAADALREKFGIGAVKEG